MPNLFAGIGDNDEDVRHYHQKGRGPYPVCEPVSDHPPSHYPCQLSRTPCADVLCPQHPNAYVIRASIMLPGACEYVQQQYITREAGQRIEVLRLVIDRLTEDLIRGVFADVGLQQIMRRHIRWNVCQLNVGT